MHFPSSIICWYPFSCGICILPPGGFHSVAMVALVAPKNHCQTRATQHFCLKDIDMFVAKKMSGFFFRWNLCTSDSPLEKKQHQIHPTKGKPEFLSCILGTKCPCSSSPCGVSASKGCNRGVARPLLKTSRASS